MANLCATYIGVFLLALLLSSQVALVGANATSTGTAMNATSTTTVASPVNATDKDKNGSERSSGLAVLLLLPLAVTGSLLTGCSL